MKKIIKNDNLRISMCCRAIVQLKNTTNGIKCYSCVKCEKLTGVINEKGERVN